MNTNIYVQSCGIAQEHDYQWLKISEDTQHIQEIPRILKEVSKIENGIKVRITDQYDSYSPSLVLARDKGELLLLVTALKAIERTKLYGRPVRNSVAWVTQDSKENEQVLRKIVVQAQRNWEELRNAIDEAVEFEPQNGFQVNRKKVEQYVENLQNQVTDSNVPSQNPEIKVVWWGISEQVEKGDAKKNCQNYILAICLLLILIVAIALIIQTLPETQREETPPTPLPTPQSQTAPTATPSPIPQNQVAPTVAPSPILDSQPSQAKLQPETITIPSAADTSINPSTEPTQTQQLSTQLEISPMKSSQENSLTRDSIQ